MYGKFLVEGDKLVRELLDSAIKIDTIFKLKGWEVPFERQNAEVIEVSEQDLRKIATHENPNRVVAVAFIPDIKPENESLNLKNGLYLACDELSDPGNAGTIIRTAEWFGVQKIFFSENSVEVFNPKVVSAAKGSLFRIPCIYTPLDKLFSLNKHLKVYGTFMDGENIYNTPLDKNAFILIGNEANGINEKLQAFIQKRIAIPSFGKAESLNAAVATAIVLNEFKRTTNVIM